MNENKNSKKEYWKGFITGLAVSVVFIVMFILGWNFNINSLMSEYNISTSLNNSKSDITFNSKEFKRKINKINKYIKSMYLEDADEDDLVDGAFKGIMASLDDPYSQYYTAEEYKSVMESTNGEYNGIGIVVSKVEENEGLLVREVYDNTPAMTAGIQENDVILKIDGKDVTKSDINVAVGYIKGEDGTTVEITVRRGDEEMDIQVKRSTIERPTVASKMLDNSIGYIKLDEFDGVSTAQFSSAINGLKDKGMKKLVIDIRDNPGGRLDVVCDILDLFVEKDKLLVYTKDKNNKGDEEYTRYDASVKDIPICILVNQNSASASEVFSGVMQDYELADIVGNQTFGKGIVQKIIDMGDGSAIKLTVSKYYLPNGENIHGEGITPDYIVDLPETGEDTQLEKALEILNR
ncbi:MAG: S41 family peptidase [Lachnospiraceae bacterium]|nr:S41 family peptidase [Lachnospiraceae bacterium]